LALIAQRKPATVKEGQKIHVRGSEGRATLVRIALENTQYSVPEIIIAVGSVNTQEKYCERSSVADQNRWPPLTQQPPTKVDAWSRPALRHTGRGEHWFFFTGDSIFSRVASSFPIFG
jgi:hypothetical protein